MTPRLRPTIRVRLTLLYGGLFLVAGIVLLGVTYGLVKLNLDRRPTARVEFGAVPAPASGPQVIPDEVSAGAASGGVVTEGRAQAIIGQVADDVRTDTLHAILTQGALALGFVGLVSIAFGYLMARRVLHPLQHVTETAQRVSGASLAFGGGPVERISLAGPSDEIKQLADTFDEMLERLAHAFDSQRRFVANASHELQTPLAINRTLVEVALRRGDASEDTKRLGESLLVVNARHERLIDGLLTLARGENAVAARSPVDLRDVAAHVVGQCRLDADAANVVVETDLDTAPTTGDPILVERLVHNLVDNAIRHNLGSGGWLQISTRLALAGEAELVVANTGPLVPSYETETLFDPFRRLQTDRLRSDRGAGLGLSIVRAVAYSHGGLVNARPRDGGGLVVTARLPSAT